MGSPPIPTLRRRSRSAAALSLAAAIMFGSACSSPKPADDGTTTPARDAGDLDAPDGAVECSTKPNVDTYAAGLQKPGVAGQLVFELVSSAPAPPARGNNTFVVKVHSADGTALSGELTAKLDMPEHGHPTTIQPTITFDPDQSAYTLEPMYLFMVGLWRITFTFRSNPSDAGSTPDAASANAAGAPNSEATVSDSGVFYFCVE